LKREEFRVDVLGDSEFEILPSVYGGLGRLMFSAFSFVARAVFVVQVITVTPVENQGSYGMHKRVAMKTCLGQCCDEVFKACPRGWLTGGLARGWSRL